MVRTTDRGQRWVGVPAPLDGLATPEPQPTAGVGEVRFADPRDGWVFAPDLWSTHNGGTTWTRRSLGPPGGQVVALEAAAGQVDAIVSHCETPNNGCTTQLWHSPVNVDNFSAVHNVSLPGGVAGPSALILHGRTGYIVAESAPNAPGVGAASMWATTDGTGWAQRRSPCGADLSPTTVAPLDAAQADVLCSGEGAAGSTAKAIYYTADAGASFRPQGTPLPRPGDGGILSAASASTLAIATASAASEIYGTNDGGQSWVQVSQFADGGVGFGDFGFTDAEHGLAVHAPAARVDANGANPSQYGPAPASLYLTANGGRTWVRAEI